MNKILIIEDDLEINALLADFLKEKGIENKNQFLNLGKGGCGCPFFGNMR